MSRTFITDCKLSMMGVHWDANAVQTVQTVADALLNLTKLFSAQNITIGPMINIGADASGVEINGVHAEYLDSFPDLSDLNFLG